MSPTCFFRRSLRRFPTPLGAFLVFPDVPAWLPCARIHRSRHFRLRGYQWLTCGRRLGLLVCWRLWGPRVRQIFFDDLRLRTGSPLVGHYCRASGQPDDQRHDEHPNNRFQIHERRLSSPFPDFGDVFSGGPKFRTVFSQRCTEVRRSSRTYRIDPPVTMSRVTQTPLPLSHSIARQATRIRGQDLRHPGD